MTYIIKLILIVTVCILLDLLVFGKLTGMVADLCYMQAESYPAYESLLKVLGLLIQFPSTIISLIVIIVRYFQGEELELSFD